MDDDEFTPIIPDNVVDYYLSRNGFQTSDIKIKRLLALATQKFVSDIATDAYEYSRIRSQTAVYNSANPQVRARALLLAGQQNVGNANDDQNENNGSGNAPSTGLTGNAANKNNEKVMLTMEDLGSALDEYGLNINRPQFYR
ncbi:unnamed protein product [[Candida] boidinii]|nr:unnamed protein product [[Candida] boidinii]